MARKHNHKFVVCDLQVKPRFKAGGVDDVVDTALGEDYDKDVLKVMTEVALACTAVSKNDRPTMKVRTCLRRYTFDSLLQVLTSAKTRNCQLENSKTGKQTEQSLARRRWKFRQMEEHKYMSLSPIVPVDVFYRRSLTYWGPTTQLPNQKRRGDYLWGEIRSSTPSKGEQILKSKQSILGGLLPTPVTAALQRRNSKHNYWHRDSQPLLAELQIIYMIPACTSVYVLLDFWLSNAICQKPSTSQKHSKLTP